MTIYSKLECVISLQVVKYVNEKWPWLHAAEKHGSGILLYNTAPKKSAIGHFWIEFLGKAVDSAEKGCRRVTFNVKILAILFKYVPYIFFMFP